MLYELNSIYCSRCKEFSPVFDAVNYDLSATEIICSNCGRILLIMKTKYQTSLDLNFNSKTVENHIRKENQKSSKKAKIQKILTGINTA
ncbi:MAG: hypothetical protein GOP50_05205 [Candidatus Heimdallarchaeota archaeon]|nr:hypothetical protein [Candidatus Heimdallarchaeota archaeon]